MAPVIDHYLRPDQLTLEETRELFVLARELRRVPARTDLAGKTLGMVFFNPSLRTRASFEVAMYQLGGHSTTLEVGSGAWRLEYREDAVMDGDLQEHVIEAVRVLSRFTSGLTVRSFPAMKSWDEDRSDPILRTFAKYSTVPVINAESALYHPCQSLADLMTVEDRLGSATREPIAITWGWHPRSLPMAVPNSILLEAAKFGMDIRLAHPPGWELDGKLTERARQLAEARGGRLQVHHDIGEAVRGARVVYAKEWGSIANYGNPEAEAEAKAKYRAEWRVTSKLMDLTDSGFFMHCLPVRRNVLVDGDVLDSHRSAAIDEAENRLHVQKALLLKYLTTNYPWASPHTPAGE